MTTPIGKARGEGNCVEATRRGKEACECVVKLTRIIVVSRILTSVARLRTETPYQAGAVSASLSDDKPLQRYFDRRSCNARGTRAYRTKPLAMNK